MSLNLPSYGCTSHIHTTFTSPKILNRLLCPLLQKPPDKTLLCLLQLVKPCPVIGQNDLNYMCNNTDAAHTNTKREQVAHACAMPVSSGTPTVRGHWTTASPGSTRCCSTMLSNGGFATGVVPRQLAYQELAHVSFMFINCCIVPR